MGSSNLPVDLQWSERASPNVNIDEALGDEVRELVATQKCWYVTQALDNERGRTMGCPRCSSGIGVHNAECPGRLEGILQQQSRMMPKQEEEPRGGRTTTKPTGPSWSGVQLNDATSAGAMQGDEIPPEVPDVEMLKTRAKHRSRGQKRSWVWKYACWKPETTFTTRPRNADEPG